MANQLHFGVNDEDLNIYPKSTSIIMNTAVLLMLISGNAFAQDRALSSGKNFVGHYSGTLDLNPIGQARFEDAQIMLNADGTAVFISDEDGEEAETSLMGIWKKTGPNTIKVAVLGFRVGERICMNVFAPPSGRNDNRCTFKLSFELKLEKNGNLTGSVLPEILEVNEDTGEVFRFVFPVTVPLADVKRTTFEDFVFPSDL